MVHSTIQTAILQFEPPEFDSLHSANVAIAAMGLLRLLYNQNYEI